MASASAVVVLPFKSQRGIIPVLPFAWLANHRRGAAAAAAAPDFLFHFQGLNLFEDNNSRRRRFHCGTEL